MASGPAYHAIAIFLVKAIKKAKQKGEKYSEGFKAGITKTLNELAKEDDRKGTAIKGSDVLGSMELLARLRRDEIK